MLFKKLGKTDILVPAIGQGTADVGRHYEGVSHEYNIRFGIDHGLTFIDTAETYADGLSEELVGKAIQGVRDKVVLSTKVKPDNLKYNDVMTAAENSLRRLRVETIDLYQIHWPNINIDISETMRAFEQLYKDGKIRCVGVSNFLPVEIDAIRSEDYSFNWIVSNQIEYNLYDRFAERYILPYCVKNDISVISYCPLNRGGLFKNDSALLLEDMAKKYGKTIYQIALNWLISKEGVVAIPFSTNISHIKQNAAAADFKLSEEDIDIINNRLGGRIEYCEVNDIKVIEGGFRNHKVYQSKEEAIENRFGFSPSPIELSQFLSGLTEEQIEMIKPIRAVRSNEHDFKYDLIEGRVRYWGWVLAFNNKRDIPLYITDRN